MINKKGQALVEFIIILPILLYIVLIVIDFGIILSTKNRMESIINDIELMYKNNETTEIINDFVDDNINDTNVKIISNEKYINVFLDKSYNFITPGLSKIFGSNYKIKVERKFYNEI